MCTSLLAASQNLAVVPILIGPLQVLLAILPALLIAIGGTIVTMLKPSSMKIGMQVLWRNKLSTLATVAIVAGIIYGFSFIPGCHHGTAAAYKGKVEWTMFRGGLERRGGGMDGAPDPVGGGTVWAVAQKFKTFYSSPTMVGNRILASAAKKEVFADRGAIYCLDAQNGAVVWEFAPKDFRATFSSPSAMGKYVVCGEGLHETYDARIFCLSFEKGQKLWEVRTSSHVESSPCIYSNMVFCGAGADGVYGLRLDTPAGTSPVVWHIKGLNVSNANFHCDASLAAVDGCVYLSSAKLHDGDWNGVACLEAATGRELWHIETPVPVWGSPTIVSNRLFIGMGNGNFVESAEQFWARKQMELRKSGKSQAEINALAPKYAAGGELWAIDLKTHEVLWTRKLRLTLLGAVAAADGRLYFSAMDGLFTCITVNNELVAQWDAHEGIKISPAIGKDHVYLATDSGRFFGLDRRTLRPVWQTRLGSSGNGELFTSSPAVGNGHIYIGTPENGLICMGEPVEPEPLWPGARGGAGKSGCVDGSSLPTKGRYLWPWPSGSLDNPQATPPCVPAACLNGTLYVPINLGSLTGLTAIAVCSGSAAASTKPPETNKWFVATTLPPCSTVAASTSRVYFAEGGIGDAGRKLHCVDAGNGGEMWQVAIEAKASGEFLLTTTNLFVCCQAGKLSSFGVRGSNAGQSLWSAPVGDAMGAPCVASDTVLVAGKNELMALQKDTGALQWTKPLKTPLVTGPTANDDIAVIATTDRLAGLSMANGGLLWSLPCAPASVPLTTDDERILCVTTEGEIVMTGWDGRERLRLKNAITNMPPMLYGDKLLFCIPGALQKVDLSEKNEESRWMPIGDWQGAITAPPILSDGIIYFATAKKGVICATQGKQ